MSRSSRRITFEIAAREVEHVRALIVLDRLPEARGHLLALDAAASQQGFQSAALQALLGEAYLGMGDLDAAAAVVVEALVRDPFNETAAVARDRIASAVSAKLQVVDPEQHETATKLFGLLVRLGRADIEAREAFARALRGAGRPEEARVVGRAASLFGLRQN